MYQKLTNFVEITVQPFYLDEQSEPEDFHFVWAYHVCIENHGDDTVQLMRRHWHITDSQGRIHEVQGEGVVGEKPILKPGESFEYTSGTPLTTPSGFMEGHYEMETKNGSKFDANIPQFSLDSPFTSNKLN